MSYNDFIDENIAPYGATKIGVYNSSGEKVGVIPLGHLKKDFGERLYRFGLLSDVHNQSDQTAESTADLQRALEIFNNKESVEMTCICGDISQNGTAAEFQIYKNNVTEKSPNTPVYTCTGNHDCTQSGLNVTNWNNYVGEKNFVIEKQLPSGKTDYFIFFSMTTWSLGTSGTPYSTADITWLSNQLAARADSRCFIFTHLFFPDRAGNLNDIYPTGNWLGGTQLTSIQNLCDQYPNTYWFSGHSHWKWELQQYQDRANIYRNNCGWCVHVPSCASPIDSNGSTREERPLESQGAIVDVYEDYIDVRAMDLKNEKYLPIGTYRLYNDGTPVIPPSIGDNGVPEGYTKLTANNFTVRNGGAATTPNKSQDGDYIEITFNGSSEKFWVQTPEMTNATNTVTLYVGEVSYSPEPSDTDKHGIGFYLPNGYYTMTTESELDYDSNNTAVQFNSSGSKYSGTYPVTIRMKNVGLKCS